MILNKILGDFLTISPAELEMLAQLDCKKFGHLRLNEEGHIRQKKVALKAVAFLEHSLTSDQEERRQWRRKRRRKDIEEEESNGKVIDDLPKMARRPVDPQAYRKLGHLHLLLENYSKSLSAYEKYGRLAEKRSSEDPDYLYGKGLVYFHFNAFHQAVKSLQQVLYLDPHYERASDVHARLGLIRKMMRNFPASLRHFRLALRSSRPCAFSHPEIRFHIAHLHEVEGHCQEALACYNELLNQSDISASLRADIHRQLGWMYYSWDSLGEKPVRIPVAIQHLQKSLELDSKSGQCLYLLGRCYASIGKVHEAFVAYRNSVDKSESNADTWCSIGVLYQQQNQPMDALQAYICAVQLEKYHGPAWTNLGMLYESSMQLQDALTCYCNAALKTKHHNPAMQQRIKYLKSQLSHMPPPSNSVKVRTLPSVEEAWNLPVSNEMAGRHNNSANKQAGNSSNSGKCDGSQSKRLKLDGDRPVPLTQNQLQTLQFLQSQPNLFPQQQQLLQQLQAQFQSVKQYQIKQQQLKPGGSGGDMKTEDASNNAGFSGDDNSQDLLFDLQSKDLGNVSDKELEALISQQDIGSFAESLLKEIEADGVGTGAGAAPMETTDNVTPAAATTEVVNNVSGSKTEDNKDDLKPCEVRISSLDIPTKLDLVPCRTELNLNIAMKGEEIETRCKKFFKLNPNGSLPLRPCRNFPPERPPKKATGNSNALSKELVLLPPTASVHLENKKDAFSPQLQQFCVQHSIGVVRGIASALKLDLGLFSTKTIVEIKPDHPLEVLTQIKQPTDENWDPGFTKQVWQCENKRSTSTVGKYGSYQTATFQNGVKEEQENKGSSYKSDLEDFRAAAAAAATGGPLAPDDLRRHRKGHQQSLLQFGSSVDLSDVKTWRAQLTELMKLPSWARVVSGSNIPSHIGYSISGCNTVKLMMSVPQARITAHQDSNCFCSIHMNIGPGDFEWFAIPFTYWSALLTLCEKNGVDFCRDAWWPNMKDLMEEEIPVYRFLQRPGDMVWVNSGCIYMVQSIGWSNSIKWNVGPLTSDQYKMSVDKFEWNKLHFARSVVPMIHLSWNLAKNIRINDESLFFHIKSFLLDNLQTYLIKKEFLLFNEVEIKYQAKKKNCKVNFCNECGEEIFALLFVEEVDPGVKEEEQEQEDSNANENNGHVICCYNCALSKSSNLKDFICIEEFSTKELLFVFENFILHNQQSLPGTAAAASLFGHAGHLSLNHSLLPFASI